MGENMKHVTRVNLECLIATSRCGKTLKVYREQLESIKK